jgi:hypothetical protein
MTHHHRAQAKATAIRLTAEGRILSARDLGMQAWHFGIPETLWKPWCDLVRGHMVELSSPAPADRS